MKLLKRFIQFLKSLWPFKTKLEKINEALLSATTSIVNDRADLKKEVNTWIQVTYGYTVSSKYIPRKGLNKTKIRKEVYAAFGTRLKACNLRLNRSLVWK